MAYDLELNTGLMRKLQDAESELSGQCGPFTFFALDSIDFANNKWKLLVAGDGPESETQETQRVISDLLKSKLTPEEASCISNISILSSTDPFLVGHRSKYGPHMQGNTIMATDPSADGTGVAHMTFLVRCLPPS
jgi:hypothetical protein